MDREKLRFYTVTEEYMSYLKKYDKRVMDNIGIKNKRPYIGVLFQIDNKKYLAPLTSPKPKHLKMKNNLDFIKINEGKYGAINLNNMFPVIGEVIIAKDIKLEKEDKYKELLINQLDWCNKNENINIIYEKAEKLYNEILNKREESKFWERCCNFPMLEEKAKEYEKELNLIKEVKEQEIPQEKPLEEVKEQEILQEKPLEEAPKDDPWAKKLENDRAKGLSLGR